MTRSLALLFAFLIFLAPACGGDDGGDEPAPDASGDEQCLNPCVGDFGKNDKALCPEPQSDWNCVDGCCVEVFKCGSDDDCATTGFDEGQCTDDRYACLCDVDSGVCFEWLCGSNDECGTDEVCDAGACVAISEALSVRLVGPTVVLTPGATGQLLVEAFDPDDPDLGFGTDVTWVSDDEEIATVDDAGLVTGGEMAGVTTVGAQLGGDADSRVSVEIQNIVPEAASTLTVVALYERSLEPVLGRYALVSSEDGTLVASGPIPEDGLIDTDAELGAGCDVHLFPEDGDFVSWLGAPADGGVLFLPVPRTAFGELSVSPELDVDPDATVLDGVNIVRGTVDFGDYGKEGVFDLTLSSTAFSSGLFDFSLETLLGPNVERYFDPDNQIPEVDNTKSTEIPGGITFGMGGPAVPEFHLTPGQGAHRVWTLGGRITMEQIAPVADQLFGAFGGGGLDFGLLVGTLFPAFADFWSGVAMTPELAGDDDMSVMPLETSLLVPLGLSAGVMPAMLPAMGELGVADAVFMLAGALTPDQLFLPLGLTADTDTRDPANDPPDRWVDGDDSTEEIEPQTLPFAPLHSGLGGPHGRYAVAVVAAALRGDNNDPRPDGGSAVLLRYDPGVEPPADITVPEFLGFPMESSWDPETRELSVAPLSGATTQRVLFKHKQGRHWTVWLNGRADYTLPNPQEFAGELEDRAATVNLVLVNSLELADGMTLETLAAPGGVNLDGLLDAVDRASFVDIRP
jgi:hypothetical protein